LPEEEPEPLPELLPEPLEPPALLFELLPSLFICPSDDPTDPCPDDWSPELEEFPELPVVLLLPSPPDLSFDFPFLVLIFTPDVPDVVVPPTDVLDPREVEDKSKLVKEFKVITLFTRPITVLVEVVVVVVVSTPSQGLVVLKFVYVEFNQESNVPSCNSVYEKALTCP
jgi:hypothetical protein